MTRKRELRSIVQALADIPAERLTEFYEDVNERLCVLCLVAFKPWTGLFWDDPIRDPSNHGASCAWRRAMEATR